LAKLKTPDATGGQNL